MYQISVRALGRLTEVEQFNNIILKPGNNGALVRLSDVGHAELGAEDYSSKLRYNGYNGIGIGVMPVADGQRAGCGQGGPLLNWRAYRSDFRPGCAMPSRSTPQPSSAIPFAKC